MDSWLHDVHVFTDSSIHLLPEFKLTSVTGLYMLVREWAIAPQKQSTASCIYTRFNARAVIAIIAIDDATYGCKE